MINHSDTSLSTNEDIHHILHEAHTYALPLHVSTSLGSYKSPMKYHGDYITVENPDNELLRDIHQPWQFSFDKDASKYAFETEVIDITQNFITFKIPNKVFKIYQRTATRVPMYGQKSVKMLFNDIFYSLHNISYGGLGIQHTENTPFVSEHIYKIELQYQNEFIPLNVICKHINMVKRAEHQQHYAIGFHFLFQNAEEKLMVEKLVTHLKK